MIVNNIPIVTLTNFGPGRFAVTLPDEAMRYVTEIRYVQGAEGFPIVTVSFVARLETENGPEPERTIWRVADEEEEE